MREKDKSKPSSETSGNNGHFRRSSTGKIVRAVVAADEELEADAGEPGFELDIYTDWVKTMRRKVMIYGAHASEKI